VETSSIVLKAIQAVHASDLSYCKFLSANDTGETESHQSGIYVSKDAVPILFNEPGIRGKNKDRFVRIRWQDDFCTDSRFIYYGEKTRNEYRITRFGRGFPLLKAEHTGDLFVLVKCDGDEYSAFTFQTEDDIEEFLAAFGMGPTDTDKLIDKGGLVPETRETLEMDRFISALKEDFPNSSIMSLAARNIHGLVYDHEELVVADPDAQILNWVDMEYKLFRRLELSRYGNMIKSGFSDVEHFLNVANMVLNRRKSRAGRSLEHHLSAIFDGNSIRYGSQVVTEGNKRPDFIFPGGKEYHDMRFPSEQLVFLGAKTTCKDRWRQVINEADRIKIKYLFTLQQGISLMQIHEMQNENVRLVIPQLFIKFYAPAAREHLWTLSQFIRNITAINASSC